MSESALRETNEFHGNRVLFVVAKTVMRPHHASAGLVARAPLPSEGGGRAGQNSAPVALAVLFGLGMALSITVAFVNLGRVADLEDRLDELDLVRGPPGTDGAPGLNGTDGAPGLNGTDGGDGTLQLSVNGTLVGFGGLVAVVSQAAGNDSTASVGGLPYHTITAALADLDALSATTADNLLLAFVMPGVYEESFTIPDGVTVRGISVNTVEVRLDNVTADTTLVTVGESCRLENMRFFLRTETPGARLIGVAWPGASSVTTKFRTAVVRVRHFGGDGNINGTLRSVLGSSAAAIGMYSNGTSTGPSAEHSTVRASTISVNATGDAVLSRGVLADSGVHEFHLRDCVVDAQEGNNSIGIETDFPGIQVNMRTGTVSGGGADVSSTRGLVSLGSTDLGKSPGRPDANGGPIQHLNSPVFMTFGDDGTLQQSSQVYFFPGTHNPSADPIPVPMQSKILVHRLSVSVRVAGGAGRSDLFTVERNGVSTDVHANLTYPDTTVVENSFSAGFAADDTLALRVNTGAGNNPTDVTVVVGMY